MTRLSWAVVFFFTLTSWASSADEPLQKLQQQVQQVIEKTESGIACILVSRSPIYSKYDPDADRRPPGQLGSFRDLRFPGNLGDQQEEDLRQKLDLGHPRYVPESYGSGVVLDRSGLILTPAHVIEQATKIYVRLPGGKGCYADVYALDPRSDLAVLKLQRPLLGLKEIPLGDADDVKKGQFIVTLSNPYAAGFRDGSPSASTGIISNVRRRLPGYQNETERHRLKLHHFGTLLQTDARITLGCSGGALLNLEGEMIGLISAQAAIQGVDTPGGFALPMNRGLRRVIGVLKQGKEVEYGFLGVQFSRTLRPNEVRLSNVIPGGPAALGGLRGQDIIVSVGGLKVHSFDDLFLALGLHLVGEKVVVERARALGGETDKVIVRLGKFYLPRKIIAANRLPVRAGLRVDHPTTLVQGTWGSSDPIPRGTRIREVVKGSPADKAGLRVNDVLTKVNGRRVTTPEAFDREMRNAGNRVTVTIEDDRRREREVKLSP